MNSENGDIRLVRDTDDPRRINGDDILHDFISELAMATAEHERPLFKHGTNAKTDILVVDAGRQEGRIGKYWLRLSNGQEFIVEAREFGISNSSCTTWHRLGIGKDVPWPGIAACTRDQGHEGKHKDRHGNEWFKDDGSGGEAEPMPEEPGQ